MDCLHNVEFSYGDTKFLMPEIKVQRVPYCKKLALHEIKVLEINANLMENDFRIKKINAKEEVEFQNKGN